MEGEEERGGGERDSTLTKYHCLSNEARELFTADEKKTKIYIYYFHLRHAK